MFTGPEEEVALSPDELLRLPELKKLRRVRAGFTRIEQRRQVLSDESHRHHPLNAHRSNISELRDMLTFLPANTAPASLGPVLAAVRGEAPAERRPKATSALSGSWGPAFRSARRLTRPRPTEGQQRRRAEAVERTQAAEARESNAQGPRLSTLSKRANIDTARVLESSIANQERALTLHQRSQRAAAICDRLHDAGAAAHRKLERRGSWPRATASLAVLEAKANALDLQRKRNAELEDVARGQAPRSQERALQQRVAQLEDQVANQVGLIKGLRERIHVAQAKESRLQHYVAELERQRFSGSPSQPPPIDPGLSAFSAFGTPRKKQSVSEHSASEHVSTAGHSARKRASSLRAPPRRLSMEGRTLSGDTTARSPQDPPLAAPEPHLGQSFPPSRWTLTDKGYRDRGVPPPVGTAAIVVLGVESSCHLWETVPEVMRGDSRLCSEVLATLRQRYSGYEVASMADRRVFVFATALAACRFCTEAQVALLHADWSPEMLDHPDNPTELLRDALATDTPEYLWRGLRVSMGVHVGALLLADPVTGAPQVRGPAVEIASVVQLVAAGGEVLVTGDVRAVIAKTAVAEECCVDVWGRLARHPSRATLHRLLPRQLEQRHASFALRVADDAEAAAMEHLGHLAQLLPTEFMQPVGVSDPPGEVEVLARVRVAPGHVDELHADSVEIVDVMTALGQFRSCVEQIARVHRGYCTHEFESHFDFAFAEPMEAVQFALRLQTALLDVDWPTGVLAVPRFAPVEVQGALLFNGVRPQIGVHFITEAKPETDPLTGQCGYTSADGTLHWDLCHAALGGEILCSKDVFTFCVSRTEALAHPRMEPVTSVPNARTEALAAAYHIFPSALRLRAAFLKRELRLEGEPVEDRTDALATMSRDLAGLQDSLTARDQRNRQLQDLVTEKTRLLATVRSELMGRPWPVVDSVRQREVSGELQWLGQTHVMAVSFAHGEELLEQWQEELAPAIDMFDSVIEQFLDDAEGTELRRTENGILRVYGFVDIANAVHFWLSLVTNSPSMPWPERIETSEHAGVVMYSDLIPTTGAGDYAVWRGLRPVAGLVQGRPFQTVNPCTRTDCIAGDCVNDAVMLMRAAQDGELLVRRDLAESTGKVLGGIDAAQLDLLEVLDAVRVVPRALAFRHRDVTKVNAQTVSTGQVAHYEPTTQTLALAVTHIVVAPNAAFDPATEDTYHKDKTTYVTCMEKLVHEHGGHVLFATVSSAELFVAFDDPPRAAAFALQVHPALLAQPWTEPLLRLPATREQRLLQTTVFRGIAVKVGLHVLEGVTRMPDLVHGVDLWLHPHLATAFLLADLARPGETLATSDAHPHLQAVHGQRHKVFTDPRATLESTEPDTPDAVVYTALPDTLRLRWALLLRDDVARHRRRFQQAQHAAEDRIERAAELKEHAGLDLAAATDMDPVDPGVHEPVHAATHRAWLAAMPRVAKQAADFRTARDALAVLETASMMAEDPLYMTEEQRAAFDDGGVTRQQQQLALHQLRTGALSGRPWFNKRLAKQLLFDLNAGVFDDDDDSDPLGLERQRDGSVPLEDLIHIHVEVERFCNLVLLAGSSKIEPNGPIVERWVAPLYEMLEPDGDAETPAARLQALVAKTAAIDQDDLDEVDVDSVLPSLIANLSLVLQKLAGAHRRSVTSRDSRGTLSR